MGSFANKLWVQILAWITVGVIVGLNVRLVITTVGDWLASAGDRRWLAWLILAPLAAILVALLAWITLEPMFAAWMRRFGRAPLSIPEPVGTGVATPVYRRILVPLDHSHLDRQAVGHALAMAKLHQAKLYLLHVEEGVTSQVYGALS
jgi:manganese transport protein